MASPSEGDVETAAAALIQAGEEICDQEAKILTVRMTREATAPVERGGWKRCGNV